MVGRSISLWCVKGAAARSVDMVGMAYGWIVFGPCRSRNGEGLQRDRIRGDATSIVRLHPELAPVAPSTTCAHGSARTANAGS